MSTVNTCYIKFFAQVDDGSINALMQVIEKKLGEGVQRFIILISSVGGSVFHGVSAYNFLKGIPAEVITHNFGSVDSIANVIYCAGSTRYSVPHARFLLHGVTANFSQGAGLEEKQLLERLKGLQMDTENMAGVIASTTGKSEEEIKNAMHERLTLSPEDAQQFGLVHEIKEDLIEAGIELISIQGQQ